MNPFLVIRLFSCILVLGLCLYYYIEKQNEITELRLAIPALTKELRAIQQENTRMQFEIDRFENPVHLIELARRPEYSHLKHPLVKDVIILPAGKPLAQCDIHEKK